MKTWGQIKGEILRLGGEEAAAYDRHPERFAEAVTRAAVPVCQSLPTVRCLYREVAAGEVLDGADIPDFGAWMGVTGADHGTVLDYRRLPDGALVAVQGGEWYLYYRIAAPVITTATPDDTPLPLTQAAEAVLPLLAAFYVWEDEDERKAVRFRNDALELLAQLKGQLPPKPAVVREGASL